MSRISEWSTTAGLNVDSPPDGWPEGMARSAVNDAAREMMAAIAKWFQDSNGSLTSTGGTLAYSVSTNNGYTALADIPLLAFRVNAANTGTVTLNVDSLGAKPWRRSASFENYTSGQLVVGQLVVVGYNSDNDEFYTIGPEISRSEFAAGTLMLFQQTSAPTGWTKQATHENKALRVTTGTAGFAGTFAFTDVFAPRTILATHLPSFNLVHTLFAASHGHSFDMNTGFQTANHTHTYTRLANFVHGLAGGGGNSNIWQGTVSDNTGNVSQDHFHDVTGSIDASGALAVTGTIHSGGGGTPIAFDVGYVDVIIAAKA